MTMKFAQESLVVFVFVYLIWTILPISEGNLFHAKLPSPAGDLLDFVLHFLQYGIHSSLMF